MQLSYHNFRFFLISSRCIITTNGFTDSLVCITVTSFYTLFSLLFNIDENDSGTNCEHIIVLSHCGTRCSYVGSVFLFQTDPLLYDLPPEVTLEEVNSFIALEHGQAMLVNVQRADGQVLCKCYCCSKSVG